MTVNELIRKFIVVLIVAAEFFLSANLNAQNSALSVHLSAKDNAAGDILMKTMKIPHRVYFTYYCALMWNVGGEAGGYCGLQNHPSGNNFIFSIWDPKASNEPIKGVFTGAGTEVLNFGGEGTGLKSWNFELGWAEGFDYQVVARRWDVGTHTFFGYWVHDISSENWNHLVTMDFPVANVYFNTATGSFLEDWSSSGQNMRKVFQKDGYKRKTDRTWVPFNSTRFSINTNDISSGSRSYNYRDNYDAGVDSGYYFMQSGGATAPSFSGTYVDLNNSFPAVPDNTQIEFYFTGLSTTSVEWTVPQSATPQFKITIKIGSSTVVDSVLPDISSFQISADNGNVVRLTIEDLLGNSVTKKAVVGSANFAPKSPPGVKVGSVNATEFTIDWSASLNSENYVVQLKENEIWKTKGETDLTTFTFSGLEEGSIQKFRVKAVNSVGESAYSKPGKVVLEANVIPQSGWKLNYVDSEETAGEDGKAVNAFDGNNNTYWHTEWSSQTVRHPHEIQIDLGANYSIDAFKYLPRQDGGVNGTIARYELYFSGDGNNWGSPAASGTFASNTSLKEVRFPAKSGRYVRVLALSEINGGAWTSAAELMFTGNLAVGLETNPKTKPDEFRLYQNYPNPFNPTTKIGFSLSEKESVSLSLYNSIGELTKRLLTHEEFSSGLHEVFFNGHDMPAGVYFYSLSAGSKSDIKKMVLLK